MGFWHVTLASAPPKKGSVHQALKSVSWCTTCSLCPLKCQKPLSLPRLTGTTQCSLGSCCARPQTGAHLMHGYPVEQPTIFPTSSSGKFSNFPSPPSQKRFLSGEEGDTSQPKLPSGRSTTILLLFFQNLSLSSADLWVSLGCLLHVPHNPQCYD